MCFNCCALKEVSFELCEIKMFRFVLFYGRILLNSIYSMNKQPIHSSKNNNVHCRYIYIRGWIRGGGWATLISNQRLTILQVTLLSISTLLTMYN